MAGVPPERELTGRPSPGAGAGVTLDHEAVVHELVDAPCDDAAREARADDQVAARPRATQSDLVEDDDQRAE